MLEIFKDNIGQIFTIFGFLATFFITKYSCKKEIDKLRKAKMMEKIEDIPMDILNLMYGFEKNQSDAFIKQSVNELAKIMHKIIAYCGKDSVKIASYIQEISYNKSFKNYELLCSYSILVSQLKFDLTGEYVSPEFYFKIKYKDYKVSMEQQIKKDINKIIKKLNISKKFL